MAFFIMKFSDIPFEELQSWINDDLWGMLSFKHKNNYYFWNYRVEEQVRQFYSNRTDILYLLEIEEWIKKDKLKNKLE